MILFHSYYKHPANGVLTHQQLKHINGMSQKSHPSIPKAHASHMAPAMGIHMNTLGS